MRPKTGIRPANKKPPKAPLKSPRLTKRARDSADMNRWLNENAKYRQEHKPKVHRSSARKRTATGGEHAVPQHNVLHNAPGRLPGGKVGGPPTHYPGDRPGGKKMGPDPNAAAGRRLRQAHSRAMGGRKRA